MITFEEIRSLLERDRSVRRFDQNSPVSREDLTNLVSLTRLCASGRNLQPLRYRIVDSREECDRLFPLLNWAGYLTEWDGPEEGERPAAYLVQCLDTELSKNLLCDDGLQLQAITLGATALGLGGCIIKSFNIPETARVLGLPTRLQPRYVLALGYPREEVRLETTDGSADADIRYWRDSEGVHHVPKRPLSEILEPGTAGRDSE